MKKAILALFMTGLVLLPRGTAAQEVAPGVDYEAILQKAMKSGKFSQGTSEIWDARVKKISGEVRVKAADSDEWAALEGEMPLDNGDTIKTADGVAEVYLDDKGAVSVGRNTELEMTSLGKAESAFTLNFGNIAAKVQHFLDEKIKMQVRTASAVCALRGTEFAVEYSQLGKDTGVAVFDEGRLAVTPAIMAGQPQSEFVLEKNTELIFAQTQKRFRAAPLSHMSRYRTEITAMRARMNVLKKSWKPVSDERKAAIRDRIFKRNVIRREIDSPKRAGKKNKRLQSGKKTLKSKAKHKTPAPAPEEEQ